MLMARNQFSSHWAFLCFETTSGSEIIKILLLYNRKNLKNLTLKQELFSKTLPKRERARFKLILQVRGKTRLTEEENELLLRCENFKMKKSKPKSKNKYKSYLRSKKWKAKKAAIFNERGKKCEDCGYEKGLHIHHLTYKRIYKERLSDLKILCSECHKKAHNIK